MYKVRGRGGGTIHNHYKLKINTLDFEFRIINNKILWLADFSTILSKLALSLVLIVPTSILPIHNYII